MKYEFKNVGLDDFVLEYEKEDSGIIETKQIPFRRTIEVAQKLQSINADAREKMFFDLTKKGKTKNDYVLTRHNPDGTIVYDETNYREMEANYLNEARLIAINEITKTMLGMDIGTVLNELKITTEDQASLFSQKFFMILNKAGEKEDNTFPCGNKNEPIPTNNIEEKSNNI
jgi:hypothetical protein